MSHEDQISKDRPDDPTRFPESEGGGYRPSGGPFRQNAYGLDPEGAAIQSCVERLDKIDTREGISRVLNYLVNRYLDLDLRDDGR